MKKIQKRRKGKSRNSWEEVTYWQSYSDMMAALLLMFALILTLSMFESKSALDREQKVIKEQETTLKQQKEDLKSQGDKLDKIIGVRSDLISALKKEFDGSDLSVYIDSDTGAITFDSNILFDQGKYDLKKSGIEFLNKFLPRYFNVLLGDDFKEHVSEIIIEGHTDTKSGYIYNLELSQKRALSVATYCLQDNTSVLSKKEIKELRKIVTANGRSFSNPVLNDDGSVDMDASRRVEFKFRLKDEEMIQEMINILNQEDTK